ncbi:MAG: hypothetical protein V4550_04580 [Gemmatimonadota bacterium]
MVAFRNWRAGHLLAAWATWWVVLVAVKLGPAIGAVLKATGGTDSKSSVAAGFDNANLHLTIVDAGVTIWERTAPFSSIVAWIALPPLLIWVAWLVARPARAELGAANESARLRSASPADMMPSRDRDRVERD